MTARLLGIAPLILLAGCGTNAPVQTAEANSTGENAGTPKKSLVSGLFSRTRQVPLPAGTALRVRLGETIDTANDRAGDSFTATLDQPVTVANEVVIPKGTAFQGRVTSSAPSGRFKGRAYLSLTLDSFEMNGQRYTITTSAVDRASGSHKKRNWLLIGGGAGTGAAIGAVAGGGTGALIGAGVGAGAGTAGAAITGKQQLRLPVETPLTFSLRSPVELKIKS